MSILMNIIFTIIIYSTINGQYVTQLPVGQKGPSDKNGNPVTPKVVPGFSKPINTNDWWSSLIWQYNPDNPYSENLFAHPLTLKADAQGLKLGYNPEYVLTPEHTEEMGQKTQKYQYRDTMDFKISIAGLQADKTMVADYSDWTVTALWENNGTSLKTTFGHGLPFVYCTKTGGDVKLTNFSQAPTIWFNQNGIVGMTVKGHHYGLFAPQGSSWAYDGVTLNSALNNKDFFSVAVLPDNTKDTLQFYANHAYAFIIDTKVSWQYNNSSSRLVTTYTIDTELKENAPGRVNKPLIALYRHQWLHTPATLTKYTYQSPRGLMKVFAGSSFTTTMTFHGVLPTLPVINADQTNYDKQKLANYITQIAQQDKKTRWNNNPPDTYWNGKAQGKIAQLVTIADQIGDTKSRDLFLNELKENLQNWLAGVSPRSFYYDSKWNALIGYPASYASDTELNDHHFHYGYFIQAAVIIALYDPEWAKQWGNIINLLIKDANNWDRSDKRFSFLRHFDPYAGHGWANGPALFGSGNNQESSSEAMNFATGVILWGTVTNNIPLRDLGIYLYTTEAEAIKQYWFDVDNAVFPSDFNKPTIGVLWGDGGHYTVWWGPSTAQEIHGINFIPITSGSLYLGAYPQYLRKNQAFMTQNDNGGVHADKWRDIHLGTKALYDPQAAIKEFNAHENYAPEGGETKAHTYFWIHMLNNLGHVDTSITANTVNYAVFNKNGTKTYVAYNPKSTSITVSFSDGATLAVPGRSIASNKTKPFAFEMSKEEKQNK